MNIFVPCVTVFFIEESKILTNTSMNLARVFKTKKYCPINANPYNFSRIFLVMNKITYRLQFIVDQSLYFDLFKVKIIIEIFKKL